MIDYIVKDHGSIVGKYRATERPSVPDGATVEVVDDVTNYEIDESVEWFPY